MTLKERILGLFKRKEEKEEMVPIPVEITLDDLEVDLDDDEFTEELVVSDYLVDNYFDFDDDFDEDTDVSTHPPLIDKEALEGKVRLPNLEECVQEFEEEFAPKRAIWGGRKTKAFVKWMEDNNLQDLL